MEWKAGSNKEMVDRKSNEISYQIKIRYNTNIVINDVIYQKPLRTPKTFLNSNNPQTFRHLCKYAKISQFKILFKISDISIIKFGMERG